MADSVLYDKARWHYGGDYPKDLPREQAFVHTGMFLGWVLENGLYNADFWSAAGLEKLIGAFKNREKTGAKVFEEIDGVLLDETLSDEGNAFAQAYFDFEKGTYLKDYEELLSKGLPSMYHVQDSWENYGKLKKRIDQRYRDWKGRREGKGRSFLSWWRKPKP